MKLLSVRFLEPVQWQGKSLDRASSLDFPHLRLDVANGLVWLTEVDFVPREMLGPGSVHPAHVEPQPKKKR
jgi:hypothetical protein